MVVGGSGDEKKRKRRYDVSSRGERGRREERGILALRGLGGEANASRPINFPLIK